MNDVFGAAVAEPEPAFWYGIPHGYRRLDLHPTPEGLEEVARQVAELPEEARDRADQVFRLYAVVVTMLQRQHVLGWALGMHPDDNGTPALSVLTVSSVPMPGVNPKAVLARMLAQGAGTGPDGGVLPVELPAGTGFLMEQVRKTTAPGAPPEGQEGPRQGTVWQGTVAIPDTASSSAVVVQLVTASVDLADDYRGVLLGVARTVTFTDPAAAARHGSGPGASGSGAEETRSPFG
ncbi:MULTISPECIES: hypothetical protein [Streptomyces]|uniref:hypothetical protein n=1 Tax=Streptomyces TaxID=1883 RepID=UPI00217506A0|nr:MULTISPECIES: hypothetical protein [unclassified Streptomyces]MCZ2527508.1 hypothetical protein [Streptomyces sp. HB2AG]